MVSRASRGIVVTSLAVLIGLVGCGESTKPTCIDFLGTRVTSYLAVKESGEDWRLVDGEATVCVEREYVILFVCDVSGSTRNVVQLAGTPEDGEVVSLGFCYSDTPRTVSIEGTMVQPGQVLVGEGFASQFTPNWSFDVQVTQGVHDLIATELGSDQPRVAIRRGLTVDEDTVEPPIDLDVEGLPTEEVPITVEGLVTGESVSVSVVLETERQQSVVSDNSNLVANVIPPMSLSGSDRQYVDVFSSTESLSRSASIDANQIEPSTVIALPPALEDVGFEPTGAGIAASWSQLPAIDFERAILSSSGRSGDHVVFVVASSGYLMTTGADSLVLDPTAPSFDPQWVLPSSPGSEVFSALRFEGTLGNTSFITSKRHTGF